MARILIVDDNPMNRELASETLTIASHQVTEIGDPESCMRELADERYDLLLLDFEMPKVRGSALIRQIRDNPELAGLPVIAYTANANPFDRTFVQGMGFDDLVCKPVSPKSLLEVCERVLAQSATKAA